MGENLNMGVMERNVHVLRMVMCMCFCFARYAIYY